MASGGKWHPDVAMATVAHVVRHTREVGDEDVMSASLGALQVVPEGRGRRRGGGGAGEGREGEGGGSQHIQWKWTKQTVDRRVWGGMLTTSLYYMIE